MISNVFPKCFQNRLRSRIVPLYKSVYLHCANQSMAFSVAADDDEKKYTAEEKAIDELETKKSVSDRKKEIEKRFQSDQTRKSSKERSDSEETQQLPDHEAGVVRRQSSEQRDIVKNVVHDDKEAVEPTSLTFQQKRLSFERGLSADKILSEQIVDDIFIVEEKGPEKPKVEKKEDKIMHIDKDKIKKEDKPMQIDAENLKCERKSKPEESEIMIAEEKNLSFAEKRLSFEQQSNGSKASSATPEAKTSEKKDEVRKKSADDTRRDSELFEGVSIGLGKLEVSEPVALEQGKFRGFGAVCNSFDSWVHDFHLQVSCRPSR